MPRSTPILGVLLLASLLANVLLAARLSREPEKTELSKVRPLEAERALRTGDVGDLKGLLVAERDLNKRLQSRIDLLETDKKVLALETPGAGGKTDKLTAFREKLRKLKKVMSDPEHKNGNGVDPDSMVELTETMMEFMKMSALRAKEPKTYADYLGALFEVGLEGEGTTMTPEQTASLNALLQGFAEELSRVPAAPAGERLLKEIQIEGAAMGKVHDLLTEAQRAAMAKDSMEAMSSTNMLSTSYVTKQGAANQIAQQWSTLYQLDPAQLPQAKLAAQSYVDAIARLEAEYKGIDPTFSKPGSAEAYAYREQMVRQQLAALSTLQGSLTSAQMDRLRTQTMKEIHIMDGNSQVEVTPAEK